METVYTVTDKTWDDDLMKGSNGEVVMGEVMKPQETTSAEMPVIILFKIFCYIIIWYTIQIKSILSL